LRTHYNMKPYVCHFCSKSFNGRGNLNIHLRIHTGERPYKCKICDKTFKTEGQIRHHLISHFNENHFQCPHCSKFYKRKGILKAHMLIHMDDPSFIQNKDYYDSIVDSLDNKSFTNIFDSYIDYANNSKNYTNNSNENISHISWEIGQQITSNSNYNEIFPTENNTKINSFMSVKNFDLKSENLNIIQNDDENAKSKIGSNLLIKIPENKLLLESSNITDIFQAEYGMEEIGEKSQLSLSVVNDENIDLSNHLLLEDIM